MAGWRYIYDSLLELKKATTYSRDANLDAKAR
jgi:hypothetical protein